MAVDQLFYYYFFSSHHHLFRLIMYFPHTITSRSIIIINRHPFSLGHTISSKPDDRGNGCKNCLHKARARWTRHGGGGRDVFFSHKQWFVTKLYCIVLTWKKWVVETRGPNQNQPITSTAKLAQPRWNSKIDQRKTYQWNSIGRVFHLTVLFCKMMLRK